MPARASHTRKRTARRTYLSVILLCSCFVWLPVFAQEATNTTSLDAISKLLQTFLGFMSRGRVILAALAGKMMTNDRVFGSLLHMDIYLWKIWNIMKNFANFALVAFLLWTLIKNMIKWWDMGVKKLITQTLIAWVLIQASWFMMGALIDISTIAVSAVGSLPSAFMQSDANFTSHIQENVKNIKKLKIGIDGGVPVEQSITTSNAENNDSSHPMSDDEILDSLMPNSYSMWWPLIFFWSSVFRFYEYLWQDDKQTAESLTIGFSLKFIVLLMYTIALLLLLIANIVRVALLWIFIIISPFIILFKVFQDDKMPGELGKDGIMKFLSLSGLIDLVFKPVLFMAMMSLILILVISIQNIMSNTSNIEYNGVNISLQEEGSSRMTVQGMSSISVNNNLFGSVSNTSKSIFADLILFFLTIFLMWELVKFALTSGEGPISKVMKPITNFAQDILKSTPMLWWFSVTSIQAWMEKAKKASGEAIGMRPDGSFYEWEEALKSKIHNLLNLPDPWTHQDRKELLAKAKLSDPSGNAFFSLSRELAGKRDGGVSLSDTSWTESFQKWLDTNGSELETRGDNRWSRYRANQGIDDFFWKGMDPNETKTKQNRKKFHELMWGDKNTVGWTWSWTPTYDELMNMHYGKAAETSK